MSQYKVKFISNAKNHPWNSVYDRIKKDTTVLDVGCSDGGFGSALQSHKNCRVDGIEPDVGDSRKATKVLNSVYNGSIEDASREWLKDKKYDHITFIDVIEHLYNPEDVLKMMRKYLKPNGTIIFSIPNMAHISTRLMLLSGKFEYGETGLLDETHLHFYTKKRIEQVFAAGGYKVTLWDHTEAVYPDELIKLKFAEMGFKVTDKAMNLLHRADARIFQYIGVAQVSSDASAKDIKVVEYSPNPQGEISSLYEDKIKAIEKNKHEQILDLKNKLNDEDFLVSQLSPIKYVRGYIKRCLRALKNHIS